MFMEQINMKYPIGTKVRLEGDYPDDPPREVAGYKYVCGSAYLMFTDGYMALMERVVE